MKTEVQLKRPLLDGFVSQKSKSEFLSATDLLRVGNAWRVQNGLGYIELFQYFKLESTKTFVSELEKTFGNVKLSERGRGKHTWIHPLLFIDLALYINPRLKIEVYTWLMDNLIKYRNDSGDSYKKMLGSICVLCKNKADIQKVIVKTANKIKDSLGVSDWNFASEEQLKNRDRIHDGITLLSSVIRDIDKIVDMSINNVLGELE